jgi:uncharacterized membrane protein (DUF2068 family)
MCPVYSRWAAGCEFVRRRAHRDAPKLPQLGQNLRMEKSTPAGMKLIIRYKAVKAAAELLVSLTFFLMGSNGSAQKLAEAARVIRHHATEAWSISLAERLLDESTAHHVFVVATALLVDGLITLLEGWALYRGFRWARWLVVGATAALIPFEIEGVFRHPTAGHVVLLLLNAIIVVYLVRRGDPESRELSQPAPPA